MIYLDNTTSAQSVSIPAELPQAGKPVLLRLRSTIDKTVTDIVPEAVSRTTGGHFHVVVVTLPEGMTCGSYEYELRSAEGTALATGCAQVGGYVSPVENFDTVIEYRQYDN